jgi:uncharacterized membrane protein
MPEDNQISESSLPNNNLKTADSQTPKKEPRKVQDFLLGVLITVLLGAVPNIIYSILSVFFKSQGRQTVLSVVEIVVFICLSFLFIKKGRKYIFIGMISALLVPLLLFGGCFLLLGSQNF